MYKRVLLKLSGEALKNKDGKQIFDSDLLVELANVIASLHKQGIDVCVVIGAGNIWRGKLAKDIGMQPVEADYMGMLGTVINALGLSQTLLARNNIKSIVFSAIPEIEGVTKNYNVKEAKQAFDNHYVLFLAGGTGKPFCTTDTAATMRAIELDCQAILAGKNGVDGVYSSDPNIDKNAKFFKNLTFKEMIDKKLEVMDFSSIELIKDKNIKIHVFSMKDPDNFIKVCNGEDIGTVCFKGE